MDARNGQVLHSENADTRLHPASLTKMMTLYIAFQAVENGEISLDTLVRISKNAAAEPPSKLGLRSNLQMMPPQHLVKRSKDPKPHLHAA
jgi:D-alanyl-D-alanine carboxypeptidase